MRIVQALYESAETGKAVPIPPFKKTKRPTRRPAHRPARRPEARTGQGAERERRLGHRAAATRVPQTVYNHRMKSAAAAIAAAIVLLGAAAGPARVPVLGQIALPHNYYYRELYLPQLTSGPSSVAWTPDGSAVIYSMQGSLWRQALDSTPPSS